MIVQEVFSRARDLLHDTASPPRWSDGIFLSWLNDGVRDLLALRPDARFDSDGAYVEPTDIEDELDIPRQHRTALVHYICYRAFARDSADTTNKAQADAHLQLFRQGLGVG